jgi:hypothetical protein
LRRSILVLALALLGAVAAAPGARAMGLEPPRLGVTTLASLVDGDSLLSGNGELVFDDFEVTVSGSLTGDLSKYKLIALDDGFAIGGPMSVSGGGIGELRIEFTVTASDPIVAAKLGFDGVAGGKGSSATVLEGFEVPVDVELFVQAIGAGGRVLYDCVDLEGYTRLRVTKDIDLVSVGPKGFAAISWLEQRFVTAPEPAALLLLAVALLGVAGARARRF